VNGRVGGVLDGGSGGQNGRHDLTYAIPAQVMLDHIKQHRGYSSVNLL
jgi:hypothetical protein